MIFRRPGLSVLALLAFTGCGGGFFSAPTLRGTDGALEVRVVNVAGARTADGGFEIRFALLLSENGGVPVTVTTADTRGLADGGAVALQVLVQNPVGGTNRLAAYQALTTPTMTMTGSASQTFPSTLAVNVAFVDDNQRQGTAQGQGSVPPPRTATIVGSVRNGITHDRSRPDAVRVVSGPSTAVRPPMATLES